MERRSTAPRPRVFDLGDPRTPMAWQHRNFNFQQEHQQQIQVHGQPLYAERFMNGTPISPSDLIQHPGDSCEEPMLEDMHHHNHQHAQYPPKYPLQYHHQQQQHAAALAAVATGQMISPHAHMLRGSATVLTPSLPTGRSPRASKLGARSRSRSAGRRPPTARCALSTSSNSSASSDSTGLDSDSQMRVDADLQPEDIRQLGVRAPTLGTLRSVQSTLSTWDGEPCPVHHVQLGFELPMGLLLPPPPPPPLYPMMAVSLPAAPPPPPPPPPPSVLLPPMLRPRPLVLAADAAGRPEPLPVRDPKASVSPLPPKDLGGVPRTHCCKGNIIVLWVVLGIIFVGILLAVILRFVTA